MDSLFDEDFEEEGDKTKKGAKRKQEKETNKKSVTSLEKKPETITYMPNELDYQE